MREIDRMREREGEKEKERELLIIPGVLSSTNKLLAPSLLVFLWPHLTEIIYLTYGIHS